MREKASLCGRATHDREPRCSMVNERLTMNSFVRGTTIMMVSIVVGVFGRPPVGQNIDPY